MAIVFTVSRRARRVYYGAIFEIKEEISVKMERIVRHRRIGMKLHIIPVCLIVMWTLQGSIVAQDWSSWTTSRRHWITSGTNNKDVQYRWRGGTASGSEECQLQLRDLEAAAKSDYVCKRAHRLPISQCRIHEERSHYYGCQRREPGGNDRAPLYVSGRRSTGRYCPMIKQPPRPPLRRQARPWQHPPPGTFTGVTAQRIACKEQQENCNPVGNAQCHPGVAHESERNDHGENGSEHEQKYFQCGLANLPW